MNFSALVKMSREPVHCPRHHVRLIAVPEEEMTFVGIDHEFRLNAKPLERVPVFV
jgi:hypothetical protein